MSLIKLIIHPNDENEQLFEIETIRATIGSVGDNDIQLNEPSISPHHFKIELRDNQWFITDLHSKTGTFVKKEKIDEAPIDRGTIFKAGDCYILFDVAETDLDFEEISEAQLPAITIQERGVEMSGVRPCWSCGKPVPPDTMFCPACGANQQGAYMPSQFVNPVEHPTAQGAGLMPLVAFVVSLFGPLLIIGWLAGIILGFISLSIIRKRGGHKTDIRRAHAAIYIGIVWFVLIAGGIGWWLYSSQTQRKIKRNETKVMEQLREIAIAENYFKLSHKLDHNKNGISDFGYFHDLISNNYGYVEESLLASPVLYDYNFEIVRADEINFCCIASPNNKGLTGLRTFIIRNDGFVCGQDLNKNEQANASSELKRIDRTSSVDDKADIIVRELYKAAAEALRQKQFDKAQRIVKSARERFPTAEEIKKLNDVEKEYTPFIVEVRARELLSQASNAFVNGQVYRSIQSYQRIVDNYPTFSEIEIVNNNLKTLLDKYAQESELRANKILETGNQHLLKMEFDKAEASYRTVINSYKSTSSAKEAQKQLSSLGGIKTEQKATETLQETLSLNINKDYEKILAKIESLTRSYANSHTVSQSLDRLKTLKSHAQARVHVDTAEKALAESNSSKALVCYRNAAKLAPAYVSTFITNYSHALLYGLSNAVVSADYKSAISYAKEFKSLKINPELLSDEKTDNIRFQLAKLSVQRGDYSNAVIAIEGCEDRFASNPEMSYIAAKIYFDAGDSARAAALFRNCYTQKVFSAEVTSLLIASSAGAAQIEESNLVSEILHDAEWLTIAKDSGIIIPGADKINVTSTWQKDSITLCDDVEMTYELLTYSGSEADLFLEKQKARNELDAQMRKLRKTLKSSIKRKRIIVITARSISEWYDICLDISTNYPPETITDDAEEIIKIFKRKQKLASINSELTRKAAIAEINTKNNLLDYLDGLVAKLGRKAPVRNVLNDVKKYLDNQRITKLDRQALNVTAELVKTKISIPEINKTFSNLETK